MADQVTAADLGPDLTALTRSREEFVVRTRFVPPKLRPQILHRPRIEAALARALEFPLTMVRADAGYGKTTAVAALLSREGPAHVWYNVGDSEVDPEIFLLHLIHALRAAHPTVGTRALARLASEERSSRLWAESVDSLSNDLLDSLRTETLLVLDDYDRANVAEVNAITERLIETMPPLLHVVITARTMPSLRSRARWRASGELLEISRSDLAFTAEEVSLLFARQLEHPVTDKAARAVAAETEGWPIALQMLSDSLRATHADALDILLRRIPGPAEHLFDYLAEEVFLRQSPEVRRFLGESACLRRLDPDACNQMMELEDSAQILRFLEQSSLFVSWDGTFRYHNLFGDFLLRRSGVSPERRIQLHRRAAAFFGTKGDDEERVYHLLAAGDHQAAADALARIASQMAASGRHQALGAWLDQLPAAVLSQLPELVLARGETYRLSSRYAEALPAYNQAREQFQQRGDVPGEIRALRGQALVYLDTVRPARAEPLLREGLRKTRGDPPARAALFMLLAENRLNAGELRRAERLFKAVHRYAFGAETHAVDARLYLREGRFAEARQLLDANLRAEPPASVRTRAPRSHRESAALLSWIEALVGDAEGARLHAAESLEVGRALGSPVVESISLARLGFGWLSGHDYDPARARAHFQDAMRTAERLGVARFKVESLLGLTILYGLEGKGEEAETSAREALGILDEAGDRYLWGVVSLALGAALTLSNRPGAEAALSESAQQGNACGDRFTPFLATLWLAISYARTGKAAQARESFARALVSAREFDYGFAFRGTALLAPRDLSLWRGMLRRAQEDPDVGEYARALTRQLDPSADAAGSTTGAESLTTAPLYIQTFGPFRAWRKGQEIPRAAWAREKALQLLQLLVCHRGQLLHRDQIMEAIWPDNSPSSGATGLRVALSALRSTLEPDRESGTDGLFVRREGEAIRLALESGIRVDADEFSRLIKSARTGEASDLEGSISLYESALALYRGEFLGENRYAEWAEAERQQRRREFLTAAERLAGLLLRTGETERASRWAETMLQHDPLHEAAYTILMEAYWRQGSRALAVRAYDRCRKRLRDSLGVGPSERTRSMLEKILQPDGAGRPEGKSASR